MSIEKELLEYKLQIKEWEKAFAKANGRAPSKADVKADQKIHRAYKTYNHLKLKQKGRVEHKSVRVAKKPAHNPLDPLDFVPVPPELDEEDKNDVKSSSLLNTELGPTPQANGKVLSLFDILSPPESSPLKARKGLPPMSSPVKSIHEFKTPTKAVKRIELSDLTPTRNNSAKKSLAGALQSAMSPSHNSPSNPTGPAIETPFYLGKISNRFRFSEAQSPSESSPTKMINASDQLLKTPSKSALEAPQFSLSPSPFKTERMSSFGINKKLTDVFNEAVNIQIDEQLKQEVESELMIEMQLEEEQEEIETSEPPVFNKQRKRITQKRTTRNWKMKPRAETEATDSFDGKNVHEEIKKIEDQKKQEMLQYMEGPKAEAENVESEDEEDFELPVVSKKPESSRKRQKLTPISNNFQRLKINDPRTKRFKQRMKRR